MPIYEYRCGQCGHEFETIQKVSDEPLEVCPACDAPTLKKKVSAAAFRLKGSGWYETDFKKDRKRNVAGAETTQADTSASDGAGAGSGSSSASAGSSESGGAGSDSGGEKSAAKKSSDGSAKVDKAP